MKMRCRAVDFSLIFTVKFADQFPKFRKIKDELIAAFVLLMIDAFRIDLTLYSRTLVTIKVNEIEVRRS